jgi:hypothetical protein
MLRDSLASPLLHLANVKYTYFVPSSHQVILAEASAQQNSYLASTSVAPPNCIGPSRKDRAQDDKS